MKKFLVRVLATIGAWVVIMTIFGLLSSLMSRQHVPDSVVLEMHLGQGLVEYLPANPVAGLMFDKTHTTRDVVDALERAAQDERVVGLLARITPASLGLAQIQEIRDAVHLFRAQGKPALAYAESLGGFGPGNGVYYLATAFDEIYIQASGGVGLTGLMFESTFFQGTLEKLGIEPRIGFRGKYKNAVNLYTQRKYTPPHKEAVQRVMDSQFDQLVRGIAQARDLDEDQVRALIDTGPFLAQDALQAQLVDGLAYRDEVYDTITERTGQEAARLSLFTYLDRAGRPHTEGDSIALIYGVGIVQSGKTSYDPLFGGPTMGADTVAAAFRRAVADTEVRAIIFRVDSRGGSPIASDTIWRETIRAKQAGKPVIVSMGNVAGSGGYFIATAADKIVAQPGTITGSIGVFGGKMLTARLAEKIGLSSDEVHTSDNATMWSSNLDFSPAQWAKFNQQLDWIYDDFTTKVAQGRKLDHQHVLSVAEGRIWTGEDAKAHGLVDELGGFPAALRLAKEAAGIAQDAPVQVRLFPRERSFAAILLSRLLDEDIEDQVYAPGAALRPTLRALQPLVRLAHDLGLGPDPGVLTMPKWAMGVEW
jgi:protease-4